MYNPIKPINPNITLKARIVNSDMPKNFRAGYIIKKPEELFEAIKDSTLYPGRHEAERKEFRSKVFFNLDGKASNRAADEILNFAQNR